MRSAGNISGSIQATYSPCWPGRIRRDAVFEKAQGGERCAGTRTPIHGGASCLSLQPARLLTSCTCLIRATERDLRPAALGALTLTSSVKTRVPLRLTRTRAVLIPKVNRGSSAEREFVMDNVPLDPALLRKRAKQCRHLANGMRDKATRKRLLSLASEYDAMARQLSPAERAKKARSRPLARMRPQGTS